MAHQLNAQLLIKVSIIIMLCCLSPTAQLLGIRCTTKSPACSPEITMNPIAPTAFCQDLEPNTLSRIQEICHGAPIRTVDWLCDADCQPYESISDAYSAPIAAVGGFISYTAHSEGSSLEIFAMDLATEQLEETAHASPTKYILSVDWCCIDGIAYLAVGGVPNLSTGFDTWIYHYDPSSGQLTLIASFAHGATVKTVSWMCQDCKQPGARYLAIGGKSSEDINIRILRFDANCQDLSLVTSRPFGATVLALDWCALNETTPLLLACGKTATNDSCQPYNIRIYCGSCTGALNPAASFYYQGKTVYTAQWCCTNKECWQQPAFAVGGNHVDHTAGNTAHCANIQLFVYNPLLNRIKALATQHLPEKVFALDWIPGCNCYLLTAGSGCVRNSTCEHNIGIFQIMPGNCPRLTARTFALYDDTVSSLSWCTFGMCSYALVGSEHDCINDCLRRPQPCNPECEIALYKAQFCQEQLPPEGICDRRSITWSIQEDE